MSTSRLSGRYGARSCRELAHWRPRPRMHHLSSAPPHVSPHSAALLPGAMRLFLFSEVRYWFANAERGYRTAVDDRMADRGVDMGLIDHQPKRIYTVMHRLISIYTCNVVIRPRWMYAALSTRGRIAHYFRSVWLVPPSITFKAEKVRRAKQTAQPQQR